MGNFQQDNNIIITEFRYERENFFPEPTRSEKILWDLGKILNEVLTDKFMLT